MVLHYKRCVVVLYVDGNHIKGQPNKGAEVYLKPMDGLRSFCLECQMRRKPTIFQTMRCGTCQQEPTQTSTKHIHNTKTPNYPPGS